MKNNYKVVVTVLLLFTAAGAFSQPGFPGPSTATPLDGGITIALLAALGIGIRKVYGKYRNK